MSCNGCRVLRKGCSEACLLRPCLQWIDGAEAQGHATVFVAKFFGRAGLMSFISAVPAPQRPALFQSLLYEACGRTVNPVSGAVGLLWSGNWHLCQAAVETVLRGGVPRPILDLDPPATPGSDTGQLYANASFSSPKRRRTEGLGLPDGRSRAACDLDLCLTTTTVSERKRPATPSMNSEGSVTTSSESGERGRPSLLNLFV
ncbi:putative transcription factor AS2-LOB family [Dioscorea sansibarensis]